MYYRSLPFWAATPLGLLSGLIIGTIVASFYLTIAVKGNILDFDDMLYVWKQPDYMWQIKYDAMSVAFWTVGLFTITFGIITAFWTYKGKLDEYGNAHWQTKSELRKNEMLCSVTAGFVCGKLGKPRSNADYISSKNIPHVMMVAPTRAGKGVGFVIPNLLSFAGSLVVLDVKGENFDLTSRQRVIKGDEVFRFSPFDWANGTHRYNPLERIEKMGSFAQQFTEVTILADLFLDKDNKQSDTFSEAGKTIFVAACLLALQRGKANFGEVNEIVSKGTNKNQQYAEYANEAVEPQLKTIWENAASTSDRLLTSNIQALKTAGLKQWDNPSVIAATSTSDFDFADFRKIPKSLYIAVSEDHIPSLAPLLRLMFADLIATLRAHEPTKNEPWPVMMMIDEFQQMGAMPYLERAIHTLASYGGRVAMIAQSLASLDNIYGREGRESLENGAGLKLYITPRDTRTVKELSHAVGSTTKEAVTRSFSYSGRLLGNTSHSVRLEERPLLTETQARTMNPDEVIILAPPQHAIKVERIKYYEDATFKKLMDEQDGHDLPYPPMQRIERKVENEKIKNDENKPLTQTIQTKKKPPLKAVFTPKEKELINFDSIDENEEVPNNWITILDGVDKQKEQYDR